MKSPWTTSILITLWFLLTLNAQESGWCKRGWVFFSPGPPFSPPLYPFFSSGPLPAGFDSESESHLRSPIPRLTALEAHHTLHPPLLYTHYSLFQKYCFSFQETFSSFFFSSLFHRAGKEELALISNRQAAS